MYIDVLEKCATFLDHPVYLYFVYLWWNFINFCTTLSAAATKYVGLFYTINHYLFIMFYFYQYWWIKDEYIKQLNCKTMSLPINISLIFVYVLTGLFIYYDNSH